MTNKKIVNADKEHEDGKKPNDTYDIVQLIILTIIALLAAALFYSILHPQTYNPNLRLLTIFNLLPFIS